MMKDIYVKENENATANTNFKKFKSMNYTNNLNNEEEEGRLVKSMTNSIQINENNDRKTQEISLLKDKMRRLTYELKKKKRDPIWPWEN